MSSARAVVTIYGLANTVIRVLGSPSKVRFTRKDYADVELRIPDVRKAHELVGFEAEIDLEEGIRMTADAIAVRRAGPSRRPKFTCRSLCFWAANARRAGRLFLRARTAQDLC